MWNPSHSAPCARGPCPAPHLHQPCLRVLLGSSMRDTSQDLCKIFIPSTNPFFSFSPVQLPLRFCGRKLPLSHPPQVGCRLRVASSPVWLHPGRLGALGQPRLCGLRGPGGGSGPDRCAHPCSWLLHRPKPRVTKELSVTQIRATTLSPSGRQPLTAKVLSQEASAKSCTNLKRPRNSKFLGVFMVLV